MLTGRILAPLRALVEGHVHFILVGGVAAVASGAPVNTFDVDVVHSRDSTNIERLVLVLEALDAVYNVQPERKLRPTVSHLASAGHQNLNTRLGRLDVLGTIGSGRAYEDLLPHTVEMDIGEGLRIKVLDLETLIAVKEEVGGAKDLAVLPILRATLSERKKLGL
jgi:predicted nucleotidyltransferase